MNESLEAIQERQHRRAQRQATNNALESLRAQERIRQTAQEVSTRPPVYPSLVGTFLQIPALRGYWSMTSRNESGNVLDFSGQSRTLTNNSATAFGVDGIVSYAKGDGSADYLSRPDEAGTSLTNEFTLVGYARSNNAPAGNETLSGKWNTTGNQRSYIVRFTSTPDIRALISSNGTAETSVTSTVAYAATTWFMYALVFVPSTSLALYINSGGLMTATTNTTSIPASIFDSTSAFAIMGNGAGSELLDGWGSNHVLAAHAVSATFVQWLFDSTRHAYGL